MSRVPIDQIKHKLGNIQTPGYSSPDFVQKVVDFFKPLTRPHGLRAAPLLQSPHVENGNSTLPDHFDFREEYPTCTRPIRDQKSCGACWAFASASALADRFCIHSNGTVNLELSPQDMVDCDLSNYGCDGGYLISGVRHLIDEGTVSEACNPYRDDYRVAIDISVVLLE